MALKHVIDRIAMRSSSTRNSTKAETSEPRRRKTILSIPATLTIACAFAQAAIGYDGSISDIAPQRITTPSSVIDEQPTTVGGVKTGFVQSTDASLVVQSAVHSAYTFAVIGGALLTFVLGDVIGRKKTVVVGVALTALGAIIQASSYGPAQFITGRVLSGLGCGFTTSSAPVWQVEASETSLRGKLVLVQLTARAAGGVIAAWVALPYGPNYHGGVSWRVPVALQLIFVAGLFLLLPILPESPRWLIKKGRNYDAKKGLALLAGKDIDDPAVQREYEQLLRPSRYQRKTPGDYLLRIFGRSSESSPQSDRDSGNIKKWRRAGIGALLLLFYGFSGFQIVFYLTPVIFEQTIGLTIASSNIATLSSSTWIVLCCCLSVALVDVVGRRRLLISAFAGQAACSIAFLVIRKSQATGSEGERALAIAMAVFAFLWLGFSGVAFSLSWLYQVEINSWDFRMAGSAIATIIEYLSSYGMVMSTPPLLLFTTGWAGLPIAINLVAVITIFLLLPETTRRSLDWLDRYFSNSPPVLVIRDRTATKVKWTSEDEVAAQSDVQAIQDDDGASPTDPGSTKSPA